MRIRACHGQLDGRSGPLLETGAPISVVSGRIHLGLRRSGTRPLRKERPRVVPLRRRFQQLRRDRQFVQLQRHHRARPHVASARLRGEAAVSEYLDRASRSGAGSRGGVQRELLRGAGRLRTDVGTGRRRSGREGRPYRRTRCRAPAAAHLCAGLHLRRFLPAGQGAAGERGLQTEKQTAAVGHRPYGGAAAVRRA